MKKLFIYPLLMVILTTSCSESLLELNNPNALTSQTAWNTQSDVESGLTGCYHTLYNSFHNSMNSYLIGGQSDEFFSQSPDGRLVDFVMLKYPDYDHNWNINSWKYLYQSVFRCNQVISYAEEVEWDSEAAKTNVLAQARAIRGMDYYYLAMLWKKAPIVDWVSLPSDQPNEATFDDLVTFIEKDFIYAAQNLKESYSEIGRVNKYFAYAFLGKLYMNSGQWGKAKTAFDEVINSGKYDLVDNYEDNFRHTTENNIESIWEIQHSDENQVTSGWYGNPNDNAVVSYSANRERIFSASPYGFGDYSVYGWVVEMYKDEKDKDGNYDLRLKNNVAYPDIFTDFPDAEIYGVKTWNYTTWSTLNWCTKYSTGYYRTATTRWSPINTRLLRYGELLMSYAECLVEIDGASAILDAADYVDQVRERANLYPLAQSVHADCLTDLEKFKSRLRIEREKEVCFEYDRFFDLRRWGLGTNDAYTNEVKARCSKYVTNFKPGREWLPIPISDESNNPNVTQNTGY